MAFHGKGGYTYDGLGSMDLGTFLWHVHKVHEQLQEEARRIKAAQRKSKSRR